MIEIRIPKASFVPLSQVPADESTTNLVYGGSRTGKTFFSGTAGNRSLYIYFRVGQGIDTLSSPDFIAKHGRIEPITVCIEETDEVSAFNTVCDAIDYALATFPEKFDVVIVDEATAFRRHGMIEGMTVAGKDLGKKKLEKVAARHTDFFIPDQGDYGAEMALIEWWVGKYTGILKSHKKHLLMLAHERHIYEKILDAQGKSTEVLKQIKPGFTGKTHPDAVIAYFDSVFYIECVGWDKNFKPVINLRTIGDKQLVAGTRFGGVFPNVIKDPNFLDMMKLVKKHRESLTRSPTQ